MRKYLFLLIIFCIGLQANAHIYNNFMEAGKYAKSDMNYPLASYFYEEALSLIPQDSIVGIYIVNANLRDVNKKLGQYDKAIHNGRKCLDILKNLGQGVKTDLMEDYIMLADILTCQREYLKAECPSLILVDCFCLLCLRKVDSVNIIPNKGCLSRIYP